MSTATEKVTEKADVPAGSPFEVPQAFLRLGFTCFGGPIAHLGFFRDEFVVRRRWIETSYATSSRCANFFRARRAARSVSP